MILYFGHQAEPQAPQTPQSPKQQCVSDAVVRADNTMDLRRTKYVDEYLAGGTLNRF